MTSDGGGAVAEASQTILADRLASLLAREASHNRWKLLQTYGTANAARNAASRLRSRYRGPEWQFRTTGVMADGRYGLGVIYKRPDPNGRAPEG